MQTKSYYASKKSIYMSIIQAAIISLFLLFLIVGFIVGSFALNAMFYVVLFIAIFCIIAFTLSPISGYFTSIDEKELIISSFKQLHMKKFEWDKVNAVVLGTVYNKYSRYNTSYYGVEVQASNEFKNLTSTYKLLHLENHEELMDQIFEVCRNRGIECVDLRKSELVNEE